jgi:hypothetical protein
MLEIRTAAGGGAKATGLHSGAAGRGAGATVRGATCRRSDWPADVGSSVGGSATNKRAIGFQARGISRSGALTFSDTGPDSAPGTCRPAGAEVSRRHHSRWNGPQRDGVEHPGLE